MVLKNALLCKEKRAARAVRNVTKRNRPMKKENKATGRLKRKDAERLLPEFFAQHAGQTYNVKDIFREMNATNHPSKMIILDMLQTLVLDDVLATDGKGNYRYAERSQVMEGTFRRKSNGHNAFLPDDGGKSILVMERNSLHALDGDRVRVTMLARRRDHTREAQVTEILERSEKTFVGRLQVERSYGFLITENRTLACDIFIPREALKGGKTGDKAVVEITEWPRDAKSPIGKVVDILGQQGDNDTEMNAILAEYHLPYRYPEKVVKAAEKIDPGITPAEVARREDLRDVTTFTIDPHDAKDFDDALSIRAVALDTLPQELRKKAAGRDVYEVGVHIADVTHYIQEGDTLDREAQQRATSIYLVDRTIPMLPERLCNELCSLRQDEDKLAYSTLFHITADGDILDWRLAHCVIRSNRRFTYEEAQYIIEENGEVSPEDLQTPGEHPTPLPKGSAPKGEYAAEVLTLNRLAKILRSRRFKNGSIAFDRAEVRFDIDETGHPVSTYLKIAKDANKLVEEFMLLANRSVAACVANPAANPPVYDPRTNTLTFPPKGKRKQQPKVLPYRIHDTPDEEKLEKLRAFVAQFGHKLKTEGSKTDISKGINQLLADVKGKKEETMVEMVALRSMMKARYSIHNIGHYGLMFTYYTHFTSPIRRYPDMMVHRLLTRYAEGGRSASAAKYESLCEHSSMMEQIAEQAERASIKYKQVEFMGDRIGQEFTGTIDGITEFGLYVEIDENGCEGMIPLRLLADDYYEFDERNFCLTGRRYHRRYALGDKLRVKVERANLERRQLDFAPAGEEARHDFKPAAYAPFSAESFSKKSKKGKGKKGKR